MDETQLFKDAWRGDKEAQATLYSVAHKHLLEGETEKAAICFKELAQAHKHATFIIETEVGNLRHSVKKYNAEIEMYRAWLKRHIDAFKLLPMSKRFDALGVRRMVRRLCAEPRLEAEFDFLQKRMHHFNSDAYVALANYFGVSPVKSLYISDVSVRVALDNIVDFYLKKSW
tara:strand:+ start:158 stop:673 length:516 start_codon:yes stop_codon:yes gene_type:complete